MTDFTRTQRTAREAEDVSKLLEKASKVVAMRDGLTITERSRLLALSARYADYAKALRETAAGAEEPDEPDLDQALMEI